MDRGAAGFPAMIPHSLTSLGELEAAAAADVVRSGWVKGGRVLAALEHDFSSAFRSAGAAACTSGTQGINLVLRALGIGAGDEVAMPSYVCRQVYDAIALSGATPIICDSSLDDFGVDPADLSQRRTAKTRAVIQPHLFGVYAPVTDMAFDGLLVIDDICQRIPRADPSGELPYPQSAAQVLSFEPTKPLTCGEGGLILTGDHQLLLNIRQLRDATYESKAPACPAPMTDIQAAVARVQWQRYSGFLDERAQVAQTYAAAFSARSKSNAWAFRSHPAMTLRSTVPFRWVGFADDADAMIERAHSEGIAIKRPVKPLAVHQLAEFADVDFPNATRLMRDIVSIPLYPGLARDSIERIVEFVTGDEAS